MTPGNSWQALLYVTDILLWLNHMVLLVAMVRVVVGVYRTASTADKDLVQLWMPNTPHHALNTQHLITHVYKRLCLLTESSIGMLFSFSNCLSKNTSSLSPCKHKLQEHHGNQECLLLNWYPSITKQKASNKSRKFFLKCLNCQQPTANIQNYIFIT